MASYEWHLVWSPASVDVGREVFSDCTVSAANVRGSPELVIAEEVARMILLGLCRDDGYISETGPELPVDVHMLEPLSEAFFTTAQAGCI